MTSRGLIGLVSGLLGRMLVWAGTIVLLATCILFARLFYAPINLDFARELVLSRAGTYLPGWQVTYETAEVGWDWNAVKPWVVVQDAQLVDRRNRMNASIQELRLVVGGSITGLGLSQVDVRDMHVNVTDLAGFSDDTEGDLFGDLFSEGMPKPEVFKPISEAFSRFSVRLLDNAPTLKEITLINVSADIARGEEYSVFSVTSPSFRLEHQGENLTLSAQLDANLANLPTRIRLSGAAVPTNGELSLTLGFSDFTPASLIGEIELPEIVQALDVPVGFDLLLDMTSTSGLRTAAFDVTLGGGRLFHPVQFPEGSIVDYGVIAASYDVDRHLLTFDEIELSLDGIPVSGEGVAFWQEGYQNPGVRLQMIAEEATIAQVQRYWPIKTYPDGRHRGARAWVSQHMESGIARNAVFKVNVEPDGSAPFANNSFFELTFDFEDIDTKYLQTMAPIRGASGRAVLTRQEFDVFIDEGSVEEISINGSWAHMYDIHIKDRGIGEFHLKLDGDAREILGILEVPPVRIGERIKVDLDRIGGAALIEAKLEVPLVKGAPKEDIIYVVSADIHEGRFDDLLKGEGLRGGHINLALDKDELTASGTAKINGVPLDLYWRENFAAAQHDITDDTSLLVLGGQTDQVGLSKLGVDISDFLDGPIQAEATFLGRNMDFRVGYFSADASEAKLMVPQLAWKKGYAAPANINGTVYFDEGSVRIEPLTIVGEQIDATASVHFVEGSRSNFDATFDARTLGRNKLIASIESVEGQPVQATITAEVLDLAPMIARDEGADQETEPESIEQDQGFNLELSAQQLLLMNGANLSNAKARLSFADDEPTFLEVSSTSETGTTDILIGASETTMRPITVRSENGGNLLRGLGLFAHMQGGALTLDGETNGWGNSLILNGELNVNDSTLVAKSQLGPEITEGVISGLDEYLEDGSIELDVVKMPFKYQEQLLDLSSVKANGPSLGMTMEGQIETDAGRINVNGVVIPAYGLNSLLGKIPLLGGLFSGGDGKGLFGVSYRVKGMTEEPEVSVNALSGLAPGFLRLIFEGRKGKVEDVEVPEGAEQEATTPETVPDEGVIPGGVDEQAPQDQPEVEAGGEPAVVPTPQ